MGRSKAKKVWSVKEPDLPVYSGVLTTGGDMVFYGTMDGWFRPSMRILAKCFGNSRPRPASSAIQ